MRTLVLLLAAMLLAVGASADLMNWQVKCGLGENVYPYGNDFSTRFGVDPNGTWDYDGRDAAHPPIADPAHDLGFIYSSRYYLIYRNEAPHDAGPFHWDAPVGWPPPWGNHGGGDAANYPSPGLLKDTRAPILGVAQPELWWVVAQAPIGGATASFIWEWNTDPGFEVPAGIQVQIWGNPDLEAAGVVGDLILNDFGPGVHKITGIPQWGVDDYGEPIKHKWVIQATLVPEPAVAQLAGLVFGIAGLGIARFRRK